MFQTLGPLELLLIVGLLGIPVVLIAIVSRAWRTEAVVLSVDIPTMIGQGWRIESDTETHTILVKGRRPNHILHLLLSVFTLGLWLIVWVVVTVTGGEERAVINKPTPR